jgi:outer membrane murein-binding lipoprotein Lpp
MHIRSLVVAAVAVTSLTVAGCSSSGGDSSSGNTTTTHVKAPVCTARGDLAAAIRGLANPALASQGKTAIEDAVGQVKQDMDTLEDAVAKQYKPEVQKVKDALSELEDAVGKLGGAGDNSDAIQEIGTALGKVATSATDLATILAKECPGGT